MPEIEAKPDYYDPWEHDEKRPKKYAPRNKVNYNADDIVRLRDELFENGSQYKPTSRDEIVGIDNVLVEIDDVIHCLKHHKKYGKYGARLEPGVIFEGDPGTGKTLVSRYIATESGAHFINVRDFPHQGSLFRDADIRDLFKRARAKYAETGQPVILFWDEFENGACERTSATPEQVATVSQLTAELDGVAGKDTGILLIGCTNYIYGIDAALKRSGRMGLQIEFQPPDRAGKKLLLSHYLSFYTLKGAIDIETLSYFFDSSDTAADIEEACVEAWRYAVRRTVIENGERGRKKPALAQEDLIRVFLKRLVGPPTAFVNLPMEDRLRIAVHEVGHALMALVYDIPLRLVTVQPGKKALGRTIIAEVNDHISTIDEMVSQLRVGIGSIVCEQAAGVPAMIGSTGDIDKVNRLATKLVDTLYAGTKTSLINPRAIASVRTDRSFGGANPNISENVIQQADLDVRSILDKCYADGKRVMADIGTDNIMKISKIVNERVTLTGQEFYDLFVEVTGSKPHAFRS